ncbi:unnamed protein product [Ranitomeya imitator]|uniref:GIY-YIG domain-containing protein n=1 Tax=Ranitomeya imitator TaxID=111125 RepID=A0ABN9LNV1_9NEOB|nr:unnamed protein product [Ranitomeya imitator]
MLVRADIGSSRMTQRQSLLATQKCGTFPCLHCPQSGKLFHIKGFYTCDSTFAVYLIKCPCGLGYVGETTQHIRDRISQHKSTIRCQRTLLPVPAHFISAGHTVAQLRFQVLECIPVSRRGGNRVQKLKEREAFWIYTLQTLQPHGMNRECLHDTNTSPQDSLEKGTSVPKRWDISDVYDKYRLNVEDQ